jgi:hypothetical protein
VIKAANIAHAAEQDRTGRGNCEIGNRGFLDSVPLYGNVERSADAVVVPEIGVRAAKKGCASAVEEVIGVIK